MVEVAPSAITTWSPRARATFEAGVNAAQLEQWDEASRLLRASLRIESHTETLMDFAFVERARGHYRTAIDVLDSLLALPDTPQPERIRAAMSELRRHVGVLVFEVTPDDAHIEVDGVRVAAHTDVPVDEGSHQVTVEAPGREPETDSVMVPGGVHRLVEIRLQPHGRQGSSRNSR